MKRMRGGRGAPLAVLLGAMLVIAGCNIVGSDDDGGGDKYTDDRSDAELAEVAEQALADGLADNPSCFGSLATADDTNAQNLGLEVETQASIAVSSATGEAGALTLPIDAVRGRLRGPVKDMVARARAAFSQPGLDALTVSETIPCDGGGTVTVTGEFKSSGSSGNSTVKYKITIDFSGCTDFSVTTVVYGEVIYAGSFEITNNGDNWESEVTVNGGIALDNSGTCYAFVFRDQLFYDWVFNDSGVQSATFDLYMRVDDFTNNVECTVSGTFSDTFIDISDGSCTVSASTL